MKSFILIVTAFIVFMACGQSDSSTKISSSKVNRKVNTSVQTQGSKSSNVPSQQLSNNRILLVEELNHLHFVFEPLDITFIYPNTWIKIEENSLIIFTDKEGTDMTFLTEVIPVFEIENYTKTITSRNGYKETSRDMLGNPDGYYVKGKDDGRIVNHYIRAIPNKGILHLGFMYPSEKKSMMEDVSKQIIQSIVYNWSKIQAQINTQKALGEELNKE